MGWWGCAAARRAATQRAGARKPPKATKGGAKNSRSRGDENGGDGRANASGGMEAEALPASSLESIDGCIAAVVDAMAEASERTVGWSYTSW